MTVFEAVFFLLIGMGIGFVLGCDFRDRQHVSEERSHLGEGWPPLIKPLPPPPPPDTGGIANKGLGA